MKSWKIRTGWSKIIETNFKFFLKWKSHEKYGAQETFNIKAYLGSQISNSNRKFNKKKERTDCSVLSEQVMLNNNFPNYSDVNLSNKILKLQISNKDMHDRETTRGLKHYLTSERAQSADRTDRINTEWSVKMRNWMFHSTEGLARFFRKSRVQQKQCASRSKLR